MENPIEAQINGPDPPPSSEDALRAELDSLRRSHQILQSNTAAMESDLSRLQSQRDEAAARNEELTNLVAEVSGDRDSLRRSFEAEEQEFRLKIEQLETERGEREGFLVNCFDSLRSVKERLVRVTEIVSDDKAGDENDSIEEERSTESSELDRKLSILEEIRDVVRLAESAEVKVSEYREMRNNERKQLGNSVVSLTEENRDISTLLRIALVEKEAVEKRLKGSGEHKRVAILQRVGFGSFGFFGGNEHAVEGGSAAKVEGVGTGSGNKSDSSECEEEVVSLASTVEKIMKNLRLEITQLRRSLEESRSDTERLQSLTEKQAQEIAENMLYIKELEDRERELVQNVEELTIEIKETEAEVARWREACELEVAAGKNEIGEREKVIAILKQELEKTRASLDISNGKLKLKEELAATAMAAHAAAEKSLQLADSRAAGLRARIDELSKQIEEAESKERNSRRVRHICWPWRTLKVNPASNRTVRRFLPEMQALLNYSG